jgi:hypothetical protein
MGDVCFILQKYIKTKVPTEKGYSKVGEGELPLMIQSFYAVKGESYTDVSLYMLDTLIIVSDQEDELPSIEFLADCRSFRGFPRTHH